MAVVPYLHYRLRITKTGGSGVEGAVGYASVSEMMGYEDLAGTGPNIFQGGTATGSTPYSASYLPEFAFDGNLSTTYESNNTSEPFKFLAYQLPSPKVLRRLSVVHIQYAPNETPDNFYVEGSNDGTTWFEIARVVGFIARTSNTGGAISLGILLSGVSKLDTGQRAVRVLIHDWATGRFVASVTPDNSGNWLYRPADYADVLVTHIGPSGYRPISDGPVTPFVEE